MTVQLQACQESRSQFDELDRDMLEFFVRAAGLLSFPRSLGEIYGTLYLSPVPLSLNEVRTRLGISVGSASQGLRQLHAIRAIRKIEGCCGRTSRYVVEESIHDVLEGFLGDGISPALEDEHRNLACMKKRLDALPPGPSKDRYDLLVNKMEKMHKNANRILSLLKKMI